MSYVAVKSYAMPQAPGMVEVASSQDQLRLARLLYFLGVASVAFLNLRLIFSLTLSDLFFLGATAAALLDLSVHGRLKRGSLPVGVLLGSVALGVGAFISSAQSQLPVESAVAAAKVVYLTTVWFWLGIVLLDHPKHVRTAVILWVASAAAAGTAAVVQLIWGNVVPGAAISWDRMSGLAQHVNDLGGITAMALIPSVALVSASRGFRRIGIAVVAAILVGAGLILSGAVGGMIAATTALGLWLLWARPSFRLIGASAIVILFLWVLVAFSTAQGGLSPLQRFEKVTAAGSANATLWSRIQTDLVAWEAVSSDPLIGRGLDSQSNVTETGFQVHNALLGAWYEAGLLGFLGLALVLARTAGSAIRSIQTSRERRDLIVLSLGIAFVAFVILGLGAPILYQRYGWMAAALLLAVETHQVADRN